MKKILLSIILTAIITACITANYIITHQQAGKRYDWKLQHRNFRSQLFI